MIYRGIFMHFVQKTISCFLKTKGIIDFYVFSCIIGNKSKKCFWLKSRPPNCMHPQNLRIRKDMVALWQNF